MGKINSFEEITAWQKARQLNVWIYDVTNSNQQFSTDYGLRDHFRRSSISISSNIAEGFERETTKEFIRFLYIAKASEGEFRPKLYLTSDLNYISNEEFKNITINIKEISKLISGFIKYLKSTLQLSTLKTYEQVY
tara:strand:+ start:2353 stop:2760 length:408 start_codon:yes stop_codon:yes gene_type:complete